MHYHGSFLLSFLATVPLTGISTPLAPAWDDTHVKHTWNAVPVNWESLGYPPDGTTIDLHVALKPHHENALVDALYEVSDPRHPKYGTHLSKEHIAELVAPRPETLELVNSWLEYHGVSSASTSTTHGGGWLTLTGVPVSQANRLLGASYQLYRHAGTNDTILRTVGYALPTVLHTHVQTVAPTTYFASARTLRQTPRKRSAGTEAALANTASGKHVTMLSGRDEDQVVPSDLRWLYKTFAYVPAATDRNVLGIAGYMNEYPSQADLTAFMAECRADAADASFTVVQVNGGEPDPSNPSTEGTIDIQYSQAIAYPTPHIFYSIGGQIQMSPGSNEPAPGDPFLEWFNYVLSQPTIPQTIVTSVGVDEKDLSLEYARAVCNLFAQLGARGVSVIFASGDDGVGHGDCKVNDDSGKVQFSPVFPASCPWVTSVGGTTSQDPEIAASISGGGFSFYFPRPSYQNAVVPTFIQLLGKKHEGLYNPAGRGIPDIAAQAIGFLIVENNQRYLVDGTSCAAPTVAGIISLLNDYLLSKGKTPLGFLNPWLYGGGLVGLRDILSGSNPGCGTDGFSAIVGWDPVTGLGTPDFWILQYKLDNQVAVGGA